jgi:hypothetical protein
MSAYATQRLVADVHLTVFPPSFRFDYQPIPPPNASSGVDYAPRHPSGLPPFVNTWPTSVVSLANASTWTAENCDPGTGQPHVFSPSVSLGNRRAPSMNRAATNYGQEQITALRQRRGRRRSRV